MNKGFLKKLTEYGKQNQDNILTYTGLGSLLIIGTALTARAAIKSYKAVERKKDELNVDKLTAKETFQCVWRYCIPPAIITLGSASCVIAGNRVSNKKNAALATAYAVTETAFQEYQSKVKKVAGEEIEKEIRKEISNDKNINKQTGCNLLVAEDGDILFYEPLTDRYFRSSKNKIEKIKNDLNANALVSMSTIITETEWFEALGLKSTAVSDKYGWFCNNGARDLIDIDFGAKLDDNGQPCGTLIYYNYPKEL